MQVDAKGILYKLTEKFDLKRDDTQDRLKLQKTIYLLQAFGLQLGYGFSWYRYGPYSQDLVQDAYTVLRSEECKYKTDTISWKFSKSSLEKFEKFEKICRDVLRDTDKLELAASVDFVRKTWYPDVEETEFIKLFKERKRRLFSETPITNSMILNALDISKKLREN